MIIINSKYPTNIRFKPDKRVINGTTATVFKFGDKIRNGKGYVNWSFTVYEDLDLKQGDQIVITSIDSVSAAEGRDGRIYNNMSGTIEIIENQGGQFEEPTPPAIKQFKAKEVSEGFTPSFDEDEPLPFDL